MFYSWACLGRLGEGRNLWCGGFEAGPAQPGATGPGRSPGQRRQPGRAGRTLGRAALPLCLGSRPPASCLSPWHALRASRRVCLLSCLSLSSPATKLCDLGFGLAVALFFRGTLGSWKEHQTWSPGAVFGSISVANSLDPGQVSASLASVSPSVISKMNGFPSVFQQ